jgi:hypothetical protein
MPTWCNRRNTFFGVELIDKSAVCVSTKLRLALPLVKSMISATFASLAANGAHHHPFDNIAFLLPM